MYVKTEVRGCVVEGPDYDSMTPADQVASGQLSCPLEANGVRMNTRVDGDWLETCAYLCMSTRVNNKLDCYAFGKQVLEDGDYRCRLWTCEPYNFTLFGTELGDRVAWFEDADLCETEFRFMDVRSSFNVVLTLVVSLCLLLFCVLCGTCVSHRPLIWIWQREQNDNARTQQNGLRSLQR